MDFATILGIFSGLFLVFYTVFQGEGYGFFFNIPAIMIVLGGTFAATFVNFPIMQVFGVFGVVKKAFFHREQRPQEMIDLLVGLAETARREGILAIERRIEGLEDDFLRKGVQLAVDGTEPELIRDILEKEIDYLEERHKLGQGIFQSMGAYAPAFGMIGTLIGLIKMLQTLQDPHKIGSGMAVALVTTFYGSILANLMFLPIAGKLKTRSEQEIMLKELILEGILAIQAGDNPRIVRDKLETFLAPRLRNRTGGNKR